jgi:DNA-binding MarR family transcriptional regulator
MAMADVLESPTPGFLVWRLAMKWRAAVDRAVAPLGLTHAQYSVLASLYGLTGAGQKPSQRELADQTGLEAIYISKLVRVLEQARFVERSEHPADPRAIQLTLTRKGRATAERAIGIVGDLQEQHTAALGGTNSPRTKTFMRTLQTLLATEQQGAKR